MSRFSQFVRSVTGSKALLSPAVFLDLGSSTTRLRIGEKVVFDEPTCVALHQKSHSTLAIGQSAQDMYGRTPAVIQVIQPLRHGKVANAPALQEFLAALFQKTLPNSFLANSLWRPTVVYAISADATTTEKDAIKKIFQNLGYTHVHFAAKATAAANNFHNFASKKKLPKVFAVIDIGGMTTEVTFFSQGSVALQKVLVLGGEDFTQAVVRTIRSMYHCEIGWQTAEKIKKSIGGIWHERQPKKQMVIRGRDILTGLPTTVHISSEKLLAPFCEIAQELVIDIQEICQDLEPEIVTEALDQGVFLTGGGSTLAQLANYLEEHLKSPMTMSATPFIDVVRGLVE